jgi:hypothetical protein
MERGNRSLQRERTRSAAERFIHERQRFRDLLPVPAAAVLIFEKDEIAFIIEPRIAARIVELHQGNQSCRFGWRIRRHQHSDQLAQPDRFRAKIDSHQFAARGVSFIEIG